MASTTNSATIDSIREEYRKLRRNSGVCCDAATWDAVVRALAFELANYDNDGEDREPSPEHWLEAAQRATVECDRCRGTGRYNWGAIINGRPQHSADCFRCGGKGRQGQDDFRRNYGYDMYRKVV